MVIHGIVAADTSCCCGGRQSRGACTSYEDSSADGSSVGIYGSISCTYAYGYSSTVLSTELLLNLEQPLPLHVVVVHHLVDFLLVCRAVSLSLAHHHPHPVFQPLSVVP